MKLGQKETYKFLLAFQIDQSEFNKSREVSKRLLVPPALYCVVPCTLKAGEEGEFFLRVFIQRQWGKTGFRGEHLLM